MHHRWDPGAVSPWLRAWQRGETGFPLVDAAMRELWVTGYTPNYCRHVVAGGCTHAVGEALLCPADCQPSQGCMHHEWPLSSLLAPPGFLVEYLGIDWRHGELWWVLRARIFILSFPYSQCYMRWA